MHQSGLPSAQSPKDPPRVVYHAQNRTFARLFNERSLDQVKDVVRRKLGLRPETDVSLKQMGPDALLDLEDDDDFQAFRVLLKSTVSVDIRVIVGKSQTAPVPPPVAPESASHSSVPSKSASTTEPSGATKETPDPSARKRRVSFGDTAAVTLDGPTEQRAQPGSDAITPVSSQKALATPKPPAGTEEPPKKKRKKGIIKSKDVPPTEDVGTPPTKVSSTTKPKAKKSAASVHESKAGEKEDGEPSGPQAQKPKKQAKSTGTVPKKTSAPPNPDGNVLSLPKSCDSILDTVGVDHPDSQQNSAGDTLPQPARRVRSSVGRSVSKARQSEQKIGVCAAIPRTNASSTVESEVAAAILSDYLLQPSGSTPLPPPAKRQSVRNVTRKPSVAQSALSSKSATEIPNDSAEQGHEHVVSTNEPPTQTREMNGPPCPICLGEPFHIRYRCPTVLKGPDSIRERLEEVKKSSAGDRQSLVKELEGLLRDAKVTSHPSLDAALRHGVRSGEALQSPSPPVSQTLNILGNSNLSEVTVESRGEGSSSESSDDMSGGRNEHDKVLPTSKKQRMPEKQPSPSIDNLEAVVRGPVLTQQSVLQILDRIIGDEDDKGSDSEEAEAELEDSEEETNRLSSRSSKHVISSSDSEGEEEESRSPSPQGNPRPLVQGSNDPVRGSTEHQDSDVVMGDSIDPPAHRGQEDNSSEETQVGSEDHMVVDGLIGEKGPTIVEELAPGTSVPQPLCDPRNEPQEPRREEVDSPPDGDGSLPAASIIPNEAEADPIEPADGFEPPTNSLTSHADPIEVLSNDAGPSFTGITRTTPKPGVTRRIKTRNGQTLDDETEHPVLLEQLAPDLMEEATPLSTRGKSRRRLASQEPTSTRKGTRSGSFPPSTSTPAAVALLNHRARVGGRFAKAAKTPAKRSEQRAGVSQSSTKDDVTQNGVHIASTPSIVGWETLAEPSPSPPLQLDEPLVRIDELMSSPGPEDNTILGGLNVKGKKSVPHTPAISNGARASREKGRLLDLTSSQIPFPYSQHKNIPPPTNGKESDVATDTDSGEEMKMANKKAKAPIPYRSLSQLASQSTLFSPSLPPPTNKTAADKAKRRAINRDSSSSSSSSDEDEANRSEHIPQGRRAAAVLEKNRRKSRKV